MIDAFSRWVEEGHIRGCRMHQHFDRFGTTDQGPAFCNELFSKLLRLSRVEEENGLVEWTN
jgi:hypothetical protein